MDRAQTRLLFVLAGLVAAVAVVLFASGPPSQEADPEATAVVWSIEADEAQQIRVARASDVVRLEKVGDRWWVREPFEDSADPDAVEDLLDVLHNVRSGIPVASTPERAAEFGLGEPPNARVTLRTADGAERTLDVGIETPAGFRTYVRDASGAVAAVNGDLNRPLQAEAERYRDPYVFRLAPEAVRSVTLPGVHLSGSGDEWWVDEIGPADPDAARALIDGLADLRFDAFGGDPPAAPASWVVGVEGGAAQTLQIEGERVRAPDGRVGAVSAAELGLLPLRADALAARSAFGLTEDVDRVTVSTGGAAEPVALSALAGVRAVGAAGAPSAVAITVEVAEGARAWRIEIGPPEADGTRAARWIGRSTYRIDGRALDRALSAP